MKKALKWVAIVLGATVVIAAIIPLFLPSTVHVERSIMIDRPPAEVFEVLTDFDQSEHWDPWVRSDPGIKTSVVGEGRDAKYTWDGPEAGAGELTFIELKEPHTIRVAIKIVRPMEDEFTAGWKLANRNVLNAPPTGDISTTTTTWTTATWYMDADLGYIERYFGSMIENMIGADYEQGLTNLKQYVESKAAAGTEAGSESE